MDLISRMIEYSTDFISTGGPLFGFFLVFIECFIPALPLSVFVALNINAFGFLLGIIISWSATSIGSILCYLLFSLIERKVVSKFLNRKTVKKIQNGIDKFKKITFPQLVLLITLPFTPSFLVNILSGLTKMNKEKFISAILIGKVFTVVFWGYIGKSFLESLTDINSIIYIAVALLIAYIISKIVSKKFEIE